MDFTSLFLDALRDTPVLPHNISPSVFLGDLYSLSEETVDELLTILSGGMIETGEQYFFSLHPLDCRMLLYTRKGSGTLRLPKKTYRLEAGTCLYMNCNTPSFWEVSSDSSSWQYIVFFIQGRQLSFYESLVSLSHPILTPVPAYSDILPGLEKLLQYGKGAALRNKLTDAGILTSIITNLWIEAFNMETTEEKCPSYLLEIRHNLDIFFMNSFSLEELENRYHISKYRICREFSRAFGLPPLKYLTKRRIDAAKNLLLASDKRIHEIAYEIGYENTTHFINMFKKETGMTPLVWRDRVSS